MTPFFTRAFLIPLFALLFVSCQKEIRDNEVELGNIDLNLLGSWNLINVQSNADITQEMEVDGNDIVVLWKIPFISTNTTGGMLFEKATASSNMMGYDVAGTATITMHVEGILVDEAEQPFATSVQPESSTSNYRRVGTDSLYFSGGSFLDSEFIGASGEMGVSYRINDNQLTITSNHTITEQTNDDGIQQTSTTKSSSVFIFQRN